METNASASASTNTNGSLQRMLASVAHDSGPEGNDNLLEGDRA